MTEVIQMRFFVGTHFSDINIFAAVTTKKTERMSDKRQ